MTKAAGHHVRKETRRLARIGLVLIFALLAGMLWAGSQYGFTNPAFTPSVVFVLGEEHVGAILERLVEHGWRVIHDVDLGSKGNIDHVLVGPAGIITVETKSRQGRIAARKVPVEWLKQAYAQAKRIERIT